MSNFKKEYTQTSWRCVTLGEEGVKNQNLWWTLFMNDPLQKFLKASTAIKATNLYIHWINGLQSPRLIFHFTWSTLNKNQVQYTVKKIYSIPPQELYIEYEWLNKCKVSSLFIFLYSTKVCPNGYDLFLFLRSIW